MKKEFYTFIGLFMMTFASFAQSDIISTYFSEYDDREDVTTVMLSGKAFELVGQIDMDEAEMKEYQDMASNVTGLRLIIDEEDQSALQTANAAIKRLPSNFEELISVKEKDNTFKLLVDEENGIVHEVVGIAGGESTFAIMSLTGEIKMSELGKVTQQIAKASSTAFAEMEELTSEIEIYPNPVAKNGELRVEFSDDLTGATVQVFNAAGQEVESFQAKKGTNSVNTSRLDKGVYVVKAISNGKEVSSKFIVQ
jgi:hypothetical protein